MWICVSVALARPVEAWRPEARMTSRLAEVWRAAADFPVDEQVVVELAPGADGAALAARLDLEVEAAFANLVQLRVPTARLGELASFVEVLHIRSPWLATPKDTVSEGYERTMLQDWHRTAGLSGAGVSVGVIDVGFSGMEDLAGTELPAEVTTNFDRGAPESSDHGTAVAEVLADFVPDAEFTFVTFGTDVEFGQGLQTLLDAQVDVVNASVGFDNVWSLDGTSFLSQAADTIVGAGIVYVGAAGNEDARYRVGELSPVGGSQYIQIGDHYAIAGSAPGGHAHVSFRWSEPFGAAKTDLDLVVVDADTEAECGRSENPQDGNDDPYEEVDVRGCGEHIYAAVYAEPGTDVTGLTGWLYSAFGLEADELTHTQSLTIPGDCFDCVAVGAYLDDDSAPAYSSRGPTEDGRTKPDLVGPSDVSTQTLGEEAFTGTSAAAPHVAGLAALWVEGTGLHDDPTAFESWQRDAARDLGEPGFDNTFGYGAATGDQPPGCGCDESSAGVGAWAWVAVAAAWMRKR